MSLVLVETKSVPLEHLKVVETSPINPGIVQQYAQKKAGEVASIEVVKREDGSLEVKEGRHRVEAARQREDDQIKARIWELQATFPDTFDYRISG